MLQLSLQALHPYPRRLLKELILEGNAETVLAVNIEEKLNLTTKENTVHNDETKQFDVVFIEEKKKNKLFNLLV